MANRIRAERERRGLKLYQLADALGVDSRTLSRWEVGQPEPSDETLERVADLLETSFAALVERASPADGAAGATGVRRALPDLPARLRAAMDAKGWGDAELARTAGVPAADLSRLLAGTRKAPSAGTIQALEDALGVRLATPPGPTMSALAANVRRLREATRPRLSRQALADLAGVHLHTISNIEYGQLHTVELATLEALASVFGVGVQSLIEPGRVALDPSLGRFLESELGRDLHLAGDDVEALARIRWLDEGEQALPEDWLELARLKLRIRERRLGR